MSEPVHDTVPPARKRVALLIDYDNIDTQFRNRGLAFIPTKVMDRVRQRGDVVSAELFVDVTTIEPQLRQELFMAGITVIDCPKLPTRNSEYLKDTVDTVVISRGHWLQRHGLADTYVIASADRDFLPFISDLRNMGHEVLIMVPSRFESPDILRAVEGSVTYHLEAEEGDGPRAQVMRLIMKGDFVSETPSISDYLIGLAAIVVVIAQELRLATEQHGFRYLWESLLCHRQLAVLNLHERGFIERLELLLEAGVLTREILPPPADPTRRNERYCYHLDAAHPFAQHAIAQFTAASS